MPTYSTTLHPQQRYFAWLLYGLFALALFHHLGTHPLYQEEPRRGLVALEMLFNDNLIVPTQFGEYYYNKPPLWNWIVLMGFELLGQNEWGLRFFSALSFLLTALLIYGVCKRHLHEKTGLYAGLFYLASVDLLYGFSVLGEIDLFYSLLTVFSFLAFFHFASLQRWWLAFLLLYGLNGLGFITKGLPSILFAGLTVISWLWYTKAWRKLYSPAHLVGTLVFLAVVSTYFWAYSQYNSLETYFLTLFNESSDRTVVTGEESGIWNSLWGYLTHLLVFPLHSLLLNALPGSVLLLWVLTSRGRRYISREPLLKYCALLLLVHIVPYLLSPGAKARYVYMLFPLMSILGTAVYLQLSPDKSWRQYKVTALQWLVFFLLPAGAIAIHLIPELQVLGQSRLIWVSVFLLLGLITCLGIYWKLRALRLLTLFLALVMLRFAYNEIVAPLRATTSDASKEKALGIQLAQEFAGQPLYIYGQTRPSRTMVFYYERDLQAVLPRVQEPVPGAWHILDPEFLDRGITEELGRFQSRKREYLIVKFEETDLAP